MHWSWRFVVNLGLGTHGNVYGGNTALMDRRDIICGRSLPVRKTTRISLVLPIPELQVMAWMCPRNNQKSGRVRSTVLFPAVCCRPLTQIQCADLTLPKWTMLLNGRAWRSYAIHCPRTAFNCMNKSSLACLRLNYGP